VKPFKIALLLLVLLASAGACAGQDVSPVADGDVTDATVDGIRILVKRNVGAELVSAGLYIRGGARNWGKADAGIEALALDIAASGGTQSLDKFVFAQRLATIGSSIDASTNRDWSSLQGKCLLEKFDETFALMADVFLRPAMTDAEFELERDQTIIGLKRESEQPEGRLALLVNDTLYKDQPYENRPQGTVASVSGLGKTQLLAHLAKLREGTRLLLVVVGDVDPERVIALVKANFGALPRGDYHDTPLPRPQFGSPRLVTEQRTLPTNYLEGWFAVPAVGEPGYGAERVAMNYLQDLLFREVRTKRNLSYAPGAGVDVSQAGALGLVTVSAVDPTTTYRVMLDQLRLLQNQPLTPAQLAGSKSTYLTDVMVATETTDGQAERLAQWQLYAGDWRLSRSVLDQVRAVTAEDVQAFAKKYFIHLQTVMLGDPGKLDPALGNEL
jgi:zinc protease